MRSLLMIPDDCIYSHLSDDYIYSHLLDDCIYLHLSDDCIYSHLSDDCIYFQSHLLDDCIPSHLRIPPSPWYILNHQSMLSILLRCLQWITDHPQANIPLLKKSKAAKGPMVAFFRAAKDRCMPQCVCPGTLDTTTRLDCFCLLMTQETYWS